MAAFKSNIIIFAMLLTVFTITNIFLPRKCIVIIKNMAVILFTTIFEMLNEFHYVNEIQKMFFSVAKGFPVLIFVKIIYLQIKPSPPSQKNTLKMQFFVNCVIKFSLSLCK